MRSQSILCEASVARVLPDGLYIHTVEREPTVLVRRQSQSMVWLDQDAIEVGELDIKHGSDVPPILKGFSEGNRSPAALSEDQERIALFKTIEREFKQADKLWNLIDEIDLSLPRRVNLRLKSLPVTIVLGVFPSIALSLFNPTVMALLEQMEKVRGAIAR